MKAKTFRKTFPMLPAIALTAATLALTAALPARATTFIKDVMLIGGTLDKTNELKTQYQAQGWSVINYDLNHGCSGSTDYIFLLYKAEEGHGLSQGYITGFYIKKGASDVNSELPYGGRTYHLTPYDGGAHFISQKGDLNSNAGGDAIHLYYTKEFLADNRAVTGIVFNDTKSGALGANGGSTGYDLNAGAGGDYVYMHVSTAVATLTVVLNGPSGEVTLEDGDVLTGTGGKRAYGDDDTHVYIADGATVTLDSATINIHYSQEHTYHPGWGGITCLGDATIILLGENTITADNCGIIVPEGKTLTIRGDGSLAASSYYAAGIGGWTENHSCGNIVIDGGTVTATGGDQFKKFAPGIGSCYYGRCGNITITTNATAVTATAGGSGAGGDGQDRKSIGGVYCGTVTLGGWETGPISISPYTYRPSETTVFTVNFQANGGSGTMASQSFASNIPQALNGNAFTIAYYDFRGWNTAADGSGTGYGDGQTILNAGNLTLYAQWTPHMYRITYDLAGGRWTWSNPPWYTVETDTFTLRFEPSRVGFTFTGWTWDGQSTPTKDVTIPKGSTGDRSFTANWSNANPKSSFDVCTGGLGDITVSGWAYDPDTPSMSIQVQVKIYQSDGTTLFREESLTADRPRDDVNSHYGIEGQHGFSATFLNIPTGTYKVKAYAIDPSGEGNNPQIGSTKTAVVKDKTMTGETGTLMLFDGDVLSGTGGADIHVLIAEGATVTLSNATITAICNHMWAGLTCLGDATIVLAGGTANAVKGGGLAYDENGDRMTYPGIYVPVGNTLTICGTGTLDADGRSDKDHYGAAGIGGGFKTVDGGRYASIDCGNIVIAGGNVTAWGGLSAAGIGSGFNGACGSITICGGTVVAYGGGYCDSQPCAIGAGDQGSCGDIAIAEGVDTVTAVVQDPQSRFARDYIGKSYAATCGTVTIYEGLGEMFLDADHCILHLYQTLILSDGSDNAAAIAGKNGRIGNATLQGRTFHRHDGYWDALCLPFDMTAEQIGEQFGGLCGLMTLHSATLIDGTLTLNFTSATAIEAGKPCLVRWSGGADWTDPTFVGVTVPAAYTNAEAIAAALAAASRKTDLVDFVGNFSPVSFASSDKTAFYLGGANTFSQPCTAAATVNSCRAYFRLKGGLRAGHEVKRCVLNLGGETITGALFASHYEVWATANGVTGAWNETDALGIHNVFRYAFNKPTGAFATILGIRTEVNPRGRLRVYIKMPPLVNTDGFTFKVVASDNVDGTGDVMTYDIRYILSTGEKEINEYTNFDDDKPKRFFRLRAVEQ